MTTFDFSPLFRTSVGYDRLASLLNSASRLEQGAGFPPYNIQRAGEDHYRITMAVAGFSERTIRVARIVRFFRGSRSHDWRCNSSNCA